LHVCVTWHAEQAFPPEPHAIVVEPGRHWLPLEQHPVAQLAALHDDAGVPHDTKLTAKPNVSPHTHPRS
jgi:hypothetical protein